MKRIAKEPPVIEWGIASRARAGAAECGAASATKLFPGGALVAVAEGLGTAEQAAVAARTAAVVLRRYGKEAVLSLVKRCDRNLMMTRGAVIALASFDGRESALTWLAVGNITGVLARADPSARPAREGLPFYEGVVGYHLPPLIEPGRVAVKPGDTLVLATQGAGDDFNLALDMNKTPQALAEAVIGARPPGAADALVLVARYSGRIAAVCEGTR